LNQSFSICTFSCFNLAYSTSTVKFVAHFFLPFTIFTAEASSETQFWLLSCFDLAIGKTAALRQNLKMTSLRKMSKQITNIPEPSLVALVNKTMTDSADSGRQSEAACKAQKLRNL
jgi:hypothetical protein